jgi:hypothetical protein
MFFILPTPPTLPRTEAPSPGQNRQVYMITTVARELVQKQKPAIELIAGFN